MAAKEMLVSRATCTPGRFWPLRAVSPRRPSWPLVTGHGRDWSNGGGGRPLSGHAGGSIEDPPLAAAVTHAAWEAAFVVRTPWRCSKASRVTSRA
jgi:hypothetical protein